MYINKSTFNDILVSDDDVLNYFKNNKNKYDVSEQIKASHILLNTSEEAQKMIVKLSNGASFSNLAELYSTGPSSSIGGDLGFFGKGAMVPEFEAAAFALEEIGDYTTEAVETQFGFHVILLVDTKKAETIEFEDVEDEIREQLESEKESFVIKSFIESERNKIVIELN